MTQTISTGALLLSTNLKTKATLKKNATSTHAQTFSGKNKKKNIHLVHFTFVSDYQSLSERFKAADSNHCH